MVGGWLRPRHKRSPSTQVHTELLNSFVTRKLGKLTNNFLKSWTMKVSTCLLFSHEFTALCLPTIPLHTLLSQTHPASSVLETLNKLRKASKRGGGPCTILCILDMSLCYVYGRF